MMHRTHHTAQCFPLWSACNTLLGHIYSTSESEPPNTDMKMAQKNGKKSTSSGRSKVCHKTFHSSPILWLLLVYLFIFHEIAIYGRFLARHSVWTLFFLNANFACQIFFSLYSFFLAFGFVFFVSCCCNAFVAFINPAFVQNLFGVVVAISGLCDDAHRHDTHTQSAYTTQCIFQAL